MTHALGWLLLLADNYIQQLRNKPQKGNEGTNDAQEILGVVLSLNLGSNILQDLDLCSCACSFLSIFKQLGSNLFTDIRLSTIWADLSRHAFYYHCQTTPLKGN